MKLSYEVVTKSSVFVRGNAEKKDATPTRNLGLHSLKKIFSFFAHTLQSSEKMRKDIDG
jgi:hypothetical protein